jgi:hypothetical protein
LISQNTADLTSQHFTILVSNKARVVVGPGLYYVGIVDTLQEWSLRKRLERWLKVGGKKKSVLKREMQ